MDPRRSPETPPAWWPARHRPGRRSFALRLGAVVIGTVAVIGAAQSGLFGRTVESTIVTAHAAEYAELALELADLAAGEGGDLDAVTDATVDNPRVEALALVAGDGRVLVQQQAEGVGPLASEPALRRALADARTSGEPSLERRITLSSGPAYAYVTELADDTALVVAEADDVVTVTLSRLRRGLLLVGALVVLAVLPLAWLLGGRQLVRAAGRLETLAMEDALTDLGNHRAFLSFLPRTVERARQHDHPLSLLVLDIDRFGTHDDAVGHARADRTLVAVAQIIHDLAPPRGAFRIAGDRFAVVLPVPMQSASDRAEHLRARVASATPVRVSIGVAELTQGVGSAQELHLAADAALRHAKQSGRDRVTAYGDLRRVGLLPTPARQAALRAVLDERAVSVVFQPLVDLDGAVKGIEALARPVAVDPTVGSVGLAFELADLLGWTVELDAVCRDAVLAEAGQVPDGLALFVNVSPLTLLSDALDPEELVARIRTAGLDPSRVVVELTEREIVDPLDLVDPVARLRRAGVRVALDDVGAGNAGLGVLRTVPLDVVKIDRAMIVAAAGGDDRACSVVRHVGRLAVDLGADVVAEGIETAEQMILARGVATLLQGYAIARPQPGIAAALAAARGHARQAA